MLCNKKNWNIEKKFEIVFWNVHYQGIEDIRRLASCFSAVDPSLTFLNESCLVRQNDSYSSSTNSTDHFVWGVKQYAQ